MARFTSNLDSLSADKETRNDLNGKLNYFPYWVYLYFCFCFVNITHRLQVFSPSDRAGLIHDVFTLAW